MKKIITILFVISLLLTGCVNKEEKNISSKKTQKENQQNLITETNVTSPTKKITDTELIAYIEEIDKKITTITVQEKITTKEQETLKNTFITLTDFIFYGGEIKGKTFNQLTDEAKQKIISIYEKIDLKIEEKYPNYKEKIKDTTTKKYNDIKTKITDIKNDIITKYKNEIGQEKYDEQTKTFEESKETMKESFEPVIDKIVEKSTKVYDSAKEKIDNWYQTWKEEKN